ncbi:MAG TPA: hypothetical protein VKB70_01835 [Gaiellaceae bacterium]|nr:hypothetical protein [Gaiellaceae bacterium]
MGLKVLRFAGFASGAVAGTVLYRRLFAGGRERVDVYFDDGSFVTFSGRSSEAARLVPLAQRVLDAVRPA